MAKFYRLNEHIQAEKLRVIDSKGQQFGILTKLEALAKAKGLGEDLIEIAPNADPPVARIVNFQKFRYEENKKERAARKGSSVGELKELWLSPRIAEHDLMVRLNRTEEFLKEGHKVKLTVKFKGREMAHPNVGHEVLQQAISLLGDKAYVEREPKFEGRKLSMIVGKNKQSLISNKLENKQSLISNKLENKQSLISNKLENKQSLISNKLENKQSLISNKLENKQSLISNKLENKQSLISNKLENKGGVKQEEDSSLKTSPAK